MEYFSTPYGFSGVSHCNCNVPLSCNRVNFLSEYQQGDADTCGYLAKSFVVPQQYGDCANGEYALMNGTFFNELNMPYVPKEARR